MTEENQKQKDKKEGIKRLKKQKEGERQIMECEVR